MKLLAVEITARSPLAFPVRKPGEQFRRSADFVPGATLYGALGMRLHQQGRFDRRLFYQIRCHNAYPAWPGDPWSRPLPRTAEQPKGVDTNPSDTMVDRVCWEQLQPAGMVFSPTDEVGRAWEAASGFYAPPCAGDTRNQIMRSVQQRVITRVSINRRRGTAEDRQLYSPLALSEVNRWRVYQWDRSYDPAREQAIPMPDFASRFLGTIAVPGPYDVAADIQAITHVGGRITSGLGHVSIKVSDAADEAGKDIRPRINTLNSLFQKRVALYQQLGGRDWHPTGDLFTIDLMSDAILLDQGWRPTMVLTAEMLREATGITADLLLLRSFASYGYASGWNLQWSRPKPSDVSTLMGSVFVFHAPQGLSEDDCKRLAALQRHGIGERCPEGYGQVRVCNEFHSDPTTMFVGVDDTPDKQATVNQ